DGEVDAAGEDDEGHADGSQAQHDVAAHQHVHEDVVGEEVVVADRGGDIEGDEAEDRREDRHVRPDAREEARGPPILEQPAASRRGGAGADGGEVVAHAAALLSTKRLRNSGDWSRQTTSTTAALMTSAYCHSMLLR